MKIALVNPNYEGSLESKRTYLPLGLAYIAAVIRKSKKHKLKVIDAAALDLDDREVERQLRDFRAEIVCVGAVTDLLKAAINVKPYSFEETILNGKRYVDATIKEPLGIEYLLDKYPDRKIVVILNEPIKRGFRHYLKNFLEGTVSGLYPYNISLYKMFMNRENLIRKDIQICLSDERILLLYPNFKNRARPRTTDPLVLQQTFNLGLEDAKKVIDFIH